MQNRILTSETLNKIGEQAILCGWIERVRSHGKIAFFDLRDMTGVLQVVAASPETVASVENLSVQTVVKIEGIIKERGERYSNPIIPLGTVEVEITKPVEIISLASEMPFDMGGNELNLQLPTLLDFRTLTLRNRKIANIFKVQAAILKGFRSAAENLGATEIVVPTISASATEGGAEVFPVNYYGYPAYLTQSPQLYKQMMVPVFERVYTIAHAYRAEPSVTTRHLSENTQMDMEVGFVEFPELLDILEQVITDTLKFAQDASKDILHEYQIPEISFGKIPRLKLSEAQEIITKEYGRDVRGEKDMGPQDEVDICSWALKNHGSDLVTITHFPTKKRAFYTMPDPTNPELSLSFDVLFRGVEISSGSQRIHEYQKLMDAITSRGMSPENFKLYLQAFEYGMPQEGGFSFGLERITMHMLNLANVREASLFPRDMERIDERLSILAQKK
ncbi:MAG: aspartate--tRNA(Asn) ligase [Candidatus Levybacteria bacterium]|nr:aspartate--tRNA(Asn) ligase [Candidatus Levybacteria bacterium]